VKEEAAGGDSAGRPDEAVARLLEAWQGEIEARAVYTILAERMRHPRRAQVIIKGATVPNTMEPSGQ
jgi:hypothetical protein